MQTPHHAVSTDEHGQAKCICGEPIPDTPTMLAHMDAGGQLFVPAGIPLPRRHPNSARFHEILGELGELHDRKQVDYGRGDDPFANVRASKEWGVAPWVGALIRLNDKVKRLQSFAVKGTLANESAADSMRDIAVYAAIALVLYEQESNGH